MLPFALPSDEPSDLPLIRTVNETALALRSLVKLYVTQPQRTEAQRDALRRDVLAYAPQVDEATVLAIATELCACPDVDFTTASTLMEMSRDAALMIHAEAVFLSAHYCQAIARRGKTEHAAAIAIRSDLNHATLMALIDRDETLVDTALADNHTITLPREIRRILLLRGQFDEAIAQALLQRRDIQPLERLTLFLRGDSHARARLIVECAPLLAPAVRPSHAERPMAARLAAFEEAAHGRYGPLAEFLGLDAAYVERLCNDGAGEPLALLCAAAELRGFDVLSVLAHWPTEPARQAGRLSALSDIATSVLPGVALALLARAGGGLSAHQRIVEKGSTLPVLDIDNP